MWKIALGFIVFAVLVMYVLTKSGADVDMGGEKHNVDAGSHADAPASPPTAAYTAVVPASAGTK